MKNLYAPRDVETLGEFYTAHVEAMTREELHDKSAIAAELAWRDSELRALRASLESLLCDRQTTDFVPCVTLWGLLGYGPEAAKASPGMVARLEAEVVRRRMEANQRGGTLTEAFHALRAAGGDGWDRFADPVAHLNEVTGSSFYGEWSTEIPKNRGWYWHRPHGGKFSDCEFVEYSGDGEEGWWLFIPLPPLDPEDPEKTVPA
jgi:hypothetical protein